MVHKRDKNLKLKEMIDMSMVAFQEFTASQKEIILKFVGHEGCHHVQVQSSEI